MFKIKRILAGLIAVLIVMSATSCSKQTVNTDSAGKVKLADGGVYPIECEDELTVWAELNTNLSTMVTNFGETEIAKKLEEKTGIKVNYIHPAQGQQAEQFNLMVASNDLPDIIRYDWYGFGAQTAISAGYILELNDYIEKWAPNFKKLVSEKTDYDKMIKTDEGSYYVFPFFYGDGKDCIYSGPIIRKDWLDKVGMDIPTTIEEWDAMLRAFKNEIGADIPLSMMSGLLAQTFAPAFGTGHAYFLDEEGNVKFGPAQDEFKDYLTLMNKWYTDGLLDVNIANVDIKTLDTNILNDRVGATVFTAAGGLGKWMMAKQGQDSSYELCGAPVPVLEKGSKSKRFNRDWEYVPSCGYAINAKCKNPELAVRFMDYGYSEEGRMLYNFGTEGVSYEMVSGEPVLSDFITKSEKGISQALMMHAMGSYSGPFVQHSSVVAHMQSKPEQVREAVVTWQDADIVSHPLPMLSFTKEEQDEISELGSEFGTYSAEMIMKFIVGTEPLEKFEEYQKQLESFNVARVIEIYTAALNRFNNR